jgi:heptaprenyl diphosphate synthase
MSNSLYIRGPDKTSSVSPVPFFAALCLFLSAVEYAVPKPLPFMRLGLANLPILLALSKLRRRDVLLLILLKVLGQALISGTLFSYVFVFSAAGSFASGLTMLVLYMLFHRTDAVSNTGLCVAGALANNCAQIAAARLIVFGENAKYIAPVLFSTGFATGLVLGIFADVFCAKSVWYRDLVTGYGDKENPSVWQGPDPGRNSADFSPAEKTSAVPVVQFVIAMVLFPVFLLQKNVFVVWGAAFVFCVMTMLKKHGKVRLLPSLLMTLGVTFFSLLSPYGKVLFSAGSFRITQDALVTGLRKSGILTGMVFLSQFAISPRLSIPGRAGRFLGSMFSIFDSLTSERISFKRGHVIEALDARLSELWSRK